MQKPDDKGPFKSCKRSRLYLKGGEVPLNDFKHRKDMNTHKCIHKYIYFRKALL